MPHRRPLLVLTAVAQAGVLASGVVTAVGWPAQDARLVQDRAAAAPQHAREAVRAPAPARPASTTAAPVAVPSDLSPVPPRADTGPAPDLTLPATAPAPPPGAASPAARAPAPAPTAAAPAPAAPPAPPPSPAGAPAPSGDQAEYEDRLVAAVNAERTPRGLAALSRDACADGPARRQAERMAAAGRLSHQDLDPVLDACGGHRAAENVGYGDVTPERMVALWMASDGHRRTVLDPALTALGSGAVRHADGRWFASHVFLGR